MRFQAVMILVFTLVLTAFGQQAGQHDRQRYVIVPSESVLLVVASQNDCPLKFENAKLLTSAEGNGAWGASYKLRNEGTKPIKAYTAVMWTSYGTGGTVGPRLRVGALLMPGQTVVGSDDEIVELTSALREKLKLQGPMKALVVLMIENIKFADGSSYDAKPTSESLLSYFDTLASKVDRAERMTDN